MKMGVKYLAMVVEYKDCFNHGVFGGELAPKIPHSIVFVTNCELTTLNNHEKCKHAHTLRTINNPALFFNTISSVLYRKRKEKDRKIFKTKRQCWWSINDMDLVWQQHQLDARNQINDSAVIISHLIICDHTD